MKLMHHFWASHDPLPREHVVGVRTKLSLVVQMTQMVQMSSFWSWSWMSWRLSASKNHGTEVLRSTAHPQFHTRPTSCYQPCGWVRSCRVPTGVFVSYKDSALHCSTRILGVLSFHPLFGRFSSRVVMGHDIPAPQATGSKKNTPKSLIHKPPLLH